MRPHLWFAIGSLALSVGCTDNADSADDATTNDTATTGSSHTTDDSSTPAAPWSAELTGVDELGFNEISGSSIVYTSNDFSLIVGGAGADGVSLNMPFDEPNPVPGVDYPTSAFTLGFSLGVTGRCTSNDVTVTFTQVEPQVVGTFAGPVTCELSDGSSQTDGTVAGQFSQ